MWADMSHTAGDLPAFMSVWADVADTNPALEIGVLAARIGHLMTRIPGGPAAGFPDVMRQYCGAYHDDVAEAGLFGPATRFSVEAGLGSVALPSAHAEVTAAEGGLRGPAPVFAPGVATAAGAGLIGPASLSVSATVSAAEADQRNLVPTLGVSAAVLVARSRRRWHRSGQTTGAAVTAAGSPCRRRADAGETSLTGIKSEPADGEEASGSHQAVTAAAFASTSFVQDANLAQSASPPVPIVRRLAVAGVFCACCGVCGSKRCTVGKTDSTVTAARLFAQVFQ